MGPAVVALLMGLLGLASQVRAQPVLPDPAPQLQRQQERERIQRDQQERRPDVHLSETAGAPTPSDEALPDRFPDGESPCFALSRVVLVGDGASAFSWALASAHRAPDGSADPVPGRCLGSQGVAVVAARVNNALIARGYVTTRVMLAPQSLDAGTLTLTVVPGKLRTVRLAADSGARAQLANALPAAGGPLNLRDIEQGLENLKRVPTVEAAIDIVPSDAPDAVPGESDLVVRWQQRSPLRLSLSVDDAGANATGKFQSSATVSLDHPLALNDLFYVTVSRDLGGGDPGPGGTRGKTAHYSLPAGHWLWGLTASTSRYHQQVAGATQDYRYSGDSRQAEASLERLVWRDAVRKTTVGLVGWMRQSRNFIDDTEVEVQRRRMAGWELGVRHRQAMADATLEAALRYRRGTGAFDAQPAPEETFGTGTARPAVVAADARLVGWLQLADRSLRYSTQWRAQWNRTPLVPQDRFSIGGRYTVRGFDGENTLSAERGWLLRNELSLPLGEVGGHEPYLGLDHGEVGGTSSALLVGRRLTGAVVGWRVQSGPAHLDIHAGWPLSKPQGFRTARATAGLSLHLTF